MFRTKINVEELDQKIALSDNILFAGSCFANSMGTRFAEYKFKAIVNPFGVIFNPISIFKLLNQSLMHTYPVDDTYIENRGIYYNFDLHGQYSNTDQHQLRSKVKLTFDAVAESISSLDWLVLTFGTAWIYERNDNQDLVANCHKMPAGFFSKRLLEVAEVVLGFNKLYDRLMDKNPRLKIVLTVSPVRHIKDNLELNMVSKSTLRLACHQLTNQLRQVYYFPSYEIMMDDLRDYRFYGEDMLHPTPVAEQYIWEIFTKKYLSPEALQFVNAWTTIKKSMAHIPFHVDSPDHQNFLRKTLHRIEKFQDLIDVQEEIEAIKRQLVGTG